MLFAVFPPDRDAALEVTCALGEDGTGALACGGAIGAAACACQPAGEFKSAAGSSPPEISQGQASEQ